MPGAKSYVLLEQKRPPQVLTGLEDLSVQTEGPASSPVREGFVISPYSAGGTGTPIVLLQPESVSEIPIVVPDRHATPSPRREDRAAYAREFRMLHEELQARRLQKVVLSRRAEVSTGDYTPEELFLRACHIYPDCYVCLFDTPQTGCWLTATPELLLGGNGSQWETMALAGTLSVPTEASADAGLEEHDFGAKNQREQALVTQHILSVLEPFATDVQVSPREVRRMGRIAHLCTPVRFHTDTPFARLGALLEQLHPTPAICGEPRAQAQAALSGLASSRERQYYAGFSGPISPNAATLYVTLRAMNLHDGNAYLYAGGGLLPESVEDAEWDETCHKMDAIERILYDRL